jgi:DNA-directed RNA polymerase specialized sigma24 family protein
MYLPPNVTETEFLRATEKVTRMLCNSFKFGYYDINDIKQQAAVFAIEGMHAYDPSRPLDNFLYTHIRNRLINFRRDKYRRNDPPCLDCHNSLPGETLHADKHYCERYQNWLDRNAAKQNILNPLDLQNISDDREPNTRSESTVLDQLETDEILQMIDLKLDVELRSVYLQMRAGENVPKSKREAVERAIVEIVKDNIECLSLREGD